MLNQFILQGSIAQDILVETSVNGTEWAKLQLSSIRSYKQRDTGEQIEDKVDIILFKKLAVFASEKFSVNDQIIIVGYINTNKYIKDGETKFSTSLIGNQIFDCTSHQAKEPESHEADGNDDLPFWISSNK